MDRRTYRVRIERAVGRALADAHRRGLDRPATLALLAGARPPDVDETAWVQYLRTVPAALDRAERLEREMRAAGGGP